MTITAPTRRLPIFRTIGRAAQLLWHNRVLHLHLLLPCIICLTIGGAMIVHKFANMTPEKILPILQSITARYAAICMGAMSLGVLLALMFSVSWRRYLLLDSKPTTLIFNRPFRHYIALFVAAYTLTVFFSAILASAALTFVEAKVQDQMILAFFNSAFVLITMSLVMLFVLRYLPLFTATAISDGNVKFAVAPAFMKGNILRYAAAWLCIAFGLNIINNLIESLLPLFGIDLATPAGSILSGALSAIDIAAMVSLTSSLSALTYDYLVRGNGPVVVR